MEDAGESPRPWDLLIERFFGDIVAACQWGREKVMPGSSFVDGGFRVGETPSRKVAVDAPVPQYLISRSAKLGEDGRNALDKIRELLVGGGNPEKTDGNAFTPLTWACEKEALGAIRTLIEAGANVESADGVGLTPLMASAMRGRIGSLSLLLALGANPLCEQGGARKGATALHYAAVNNHGECARVLAAAGASFEKKMAGGATPLLLAHQNGGESIISAFETDEIAKLLDENPIPSEKKRSGGRGRL